MVIEDNGEWFFLLCISFFMRYVFWIPVNSIVYMYNGYTWGLSVCVFTRE